MSHEKLHIVQPSQTMLMAFLIACAITSLLVHFVLSLRSFRIVRVFLDFLGLASIPVVGYLILFAMTPNAGNATGSGLQWMLIATVMSAGLFIIFVVLVVALAVRVIRRGFGLFRRPVM